MQRSPDCMVICSIYERYKLRELIAKHWTKASQYCEGTCRTTRKDRKIFENKQPLILQQEDNYRESLSFSFHHHTLVSHINNSGLRTIHVTYCQGNTPHKHSDIKR